jgi:A1 cistron-splicing factor AAR2
MKFNHIFRKKPVCFGVVSYWGSMSAFVVLGTLPAGIDFGIDAMSYTTGPDFKGLSLIPKGLHFVYHSTGLGARQGFFLRIKEDGVIARSWNASNEEIEAKDALDSAQLENLAQAIKRGEFNNNLGPYPFDQHRAWRNLTNFISNKVLQGADCLPGAMILPGDALDIAAMGVMGGAASSMLSKGPSAVAPYMPGAARVPKWSDAKAIESSLRESIVSDPRVDERAKGERLSALRMDRTLIVETLVDVEHEKHLLSLLGEMQLSFVLFLLLYSHPALQHWMATVDLLCNSESLLKRDLQFTQYLLRVLYEQLNFVPLDFFSDELSKENFLGPAMSALFSSLSPATSGGGGSFGATSTSSSTTEDAFARNELVEEHRARLLAFVRKKFGLFAESPVKAQMAMSRLSGRGRGMGSGEKMEQQNQQQQQQQYLDLDAEETADLLSGIDMGAGVGIGMGTGDVPEDMPVVVSIDIDSSHALATTSSIGDSAQLSSSSSESLAEQELGRGKAKLGAWGQALDSSISSIASPPPRAAAAAAAAAVYASDTETSAESTAAAAKQPLPPLSPSDMEREKHAWRYPYLYEEIVAAGARGVQEDFVMAAVRVLEETAVAAALGGGDDNNNNNNSSSNVARAEALLYLEEEVSKQRSH